MNIVFDDDGDYSDEDSNDDIDGILYGVYDSPSDNEEEVCNLM